MPNDPKSIPHESVCALRTLAIWWISRLHGRLFVSGWLFFLWNFIHLATTARMLMFQLLMRTIRSFFLFIHCQGFPAFITIIRKIKYTSHYSVSIACVLYVGACIYKHTNHTKVHQMLFRGVCVECHCICWIYLATLKSGDKIIDFVTSIKQMHDKCMWIIN